MIKYIRGFLVRLMATLRGRPRTIPQIEWSDKSIVHNVFRLYEVVFGRDLGADGSGIRCESVTGIDEYGNYFRKTFTFEARCAYIETDIRQFVRKWASARLVFRPVYIEVPVFAFVGQHGGRWNTVRTGYSLAIAFDAFTADTTAASPNTVSHTCTGSNGWLNTIIFTSTVSQVMSSVTYNSAALTQGSDRGTQDPSMGYYANEIWYKASPTTGSNTLSYSWTGGGNVFAYAASYSGVTNTSLGGKSSIEDASGTTFNTTLTATGGGWVIWGGSGDGSLPTGVTTGSMRASVGSHWCLADSNGTVSAGSYAFGYTNSSGTKGSINGLEFGVAAAGAPKYVGFFSMTEKA